MSELNPVLYPRDAMNQWLGTGAAKSSYTLDEFLKLIGPTYQIEECATLMGQLQSEWQMRADSSQQTAPQMDGMSL